MDQHRTCERPGCTYQCTRPHHWARHRNHCPADHEDLYRLTVAVRVGDCWVPRVVEEGGRAKVRGGRRAHRVSLEMKLGRPLLPDMCACHTCDVPNCLNPDHLWEGTQADNMRDMWTKGRGVLHVENFIPGGPTRRWPPSVKAMW